MKMYSDLFNRMKILKDWPTFILFATYVTHSPDAPMRISRRDNLMILQDLSRVHTSKKTPAFLKTLESRGNRLIFSKHNFCVIYPLFTPTGAQWEVL